MRPAPPAHMLFELRRDPRLRPLRHGAQGIAFEARDRAHRLELRLHQCAAFYQMADSIALPCYSWTAFGIRRQIELIIIGHCQCPRLFIKIPCQMPLGCGKQQFIVHRLLLTCLVGTKTIKMADMFPVDMHLTLIIDIDRNRRCIKAASAQQHGGASIHKALAQRIVQRVGQPFLKLARPRGHGWRVLDPVGTVCDVGPSARGGDPSGQRIDIALDIVEPRNFTGDIAVWQWLTARQMLPQASDEAAMMFGTRLAEVR